MVNGLCFDEDLVERFIGFVFGDLVDMVDHLGKVLRMGWMMYLFDIGVILFLNHDKDDILVRLVNIVSFVVFLLLHKDDVIELL